MNRGMKPVLAISVAINVLLAGMVLGGVSHGYIVPQPPAATFDIAGQLAHLPEDKRALYESIMGPAKQKMDAERAQIDNEKKLALKILKSEPFNEDAYLKQVQHIYELAGQMKLHVAQSVVELAKHLTPQEREVVAGIISHPPFTASPPGISRQDNSPAAASQ